MIEKKIIYCLLGVLILFSVSSGCAIKKANSLPVNKSNNFQWPDSQLKDKFGAYWGYRSSGDFANALKLEAPYVKEMVDIERYTEFLKTAGKRSWNAVRIDKIEWVNQNLLFIGLTAEIKEDASGRIQEVFFSDRWVLMNEKWFHAFDDLIITLDK